MKNELNLIDKVFVFFYCIVDKKQEDSFKLVGALIGGLISLFYLMLIFITAMLFHYEIIKMVYITIIPIIIVIAIYYYYNKYLFKDDRYKYLISIYKGKSSNTKNSNQTLCILLLILVISMLFATAIVYGKNKKKPHSSTLPQVMLFLAKRD